MATGKTSIAVFVVACALVGYALPLEAATLILAWDHSPDRDVAGYVISYGTKPANYTDNVKVGYVTSATVTGLANETTYYFVMQSDDSGGTVGPTSPEITGKTAISSTPVTVACPSPVLTSPDGKAMPVTLTPKVTGGVQPYTTTCSPTSGSLFPVGTTSISCTATDAMQQKDSCASTVVVLTSDKATPLKITCPTIAPVTATGNSEKARVTFPDPEFSGGTAPFAVSCMPKSGSQFEIGTTTVSCKATDAASQTAACKISVTVLTPPARNPKEPPAK